MDTHKIPPHNLLSEQSVLGGILIENAAILEALGILSSKDFYRDGHRQIFDCMIELSVGKTPIDIITLTNLLKKKGILDEVGGVPYIAMLVDSVPTAANISSYINIVKECSVARQLITLTAKIQTKAYDSDGTIDEVLGNAQREVMALSVKEQRQSLTHIREAVSQAFRTMERAYESPSCISGLPTGLTQLDRMLGGLQPTDLIILGARPSQGKTALCLNIADHIAGRGETVLICELEMSKEQLALRQLSARANVEGSRLKHGNISEDQWARLSCAAGTIAGQNIIINDSARQTEMDIYNSAMKVKAEYGSLGLIVIDYLQLMGASVKQENRNQEVSYISRMLKGIAKEFNVPVLALSQLNRTLESRADKRPMLSDLRESGSLEQDSDVVMFLYRDEVYNSFPENPNRGIAEIIIAKQRNGPVGTVEVAWNGKLTQFSDLQNTN